jgi:hypothetical protein
MSSKRSDSISNCWLTLAAATTTVPFTMQSGGGSRGGAHRRGRGAGSCCWDTGRLLFHHVPDSLQRFRRHPGPLRFFLALTFPGYHYHGLDCIRRDSVRGLHDLNYYATAPLTSFQRVHRTTPHCCRGSGDVSLPSVRWHTSVSSLASTSGS